MSIFSIFSISLCLVLIFGIAHLSTLHLEQVAAQSRLDICATAIAIEKQTLLEKLFHSNQNMKALQKIVYAARGLQIIAPVSSAALHMGEKVALATLKGLEKYQNLLIHLSSLKELRLSYCTPTKYSRDLETCTLSITKASDFVRKKTIFADVPGELKKISSVEEKIHCYGITRAHQILASNLIFRSKFQLEENNFTYAYME